jgi:uncharacterized membrane protein
VILSPLVVALLVVALIFALVGFTDAAKVLAVVAVVLLLLGAVA